MKLPSIKVNIAKYIEHVGCGSLDEYGQCENCNAIREILRGWESLMNGSIDDV